MSTLLLTRSEINELVAMPEVIETVEKTFKGMGEGDVINPPKVHLDLGDGNSGLPYSAGMNAMPAYVGWQKIAGLKFIGGWEGNPSKGLPYLSGMIFLVNPQDGQFLAVMDGILITNFRTGAQAAVALKYLIKNSKEPIIGLFGAGAQGRTQTLAVCTAFNVKELRVYDVNPNASRAFAEEMTQKVNVPIKIMDKPEDVTIGCDAVISVTHAKNQFITNDMIGRGVTVLPLGSFRECADDLILSVDKIIVDNIEQCLHRGTLKAVVESGKLNRSNIYATIGEIVAGKKAGRESAEERIMCITIGMGALDVAVASLIYEKALAKGVGTTFSFV